MLKAVVLAAGASSRMRRPKAALPLLHAGDTFLSRLCRTLLDAGLSQVTIVTGAVPSIVDTAWPDRDPGVGVVHNPNWHSGQLSSILAGLEAVDDGSLEALMVALVDLPLVTGATVRQLADTWHATGAPIVRPSRGGQHGHPVIFDRATFEHLRRADRALGAKLVVHAHLATLIDVPVDDDGAFRDADTDDDYQALLRRLAR